MKGEAIKKGSVGTRRSFLKTTTALAGASLMGLPEAAAANKRHPKRGGTLRFGTREDTIGLDTHRNIIYFVSTPLTAITGGLVDFDDKMQPKPAVAESWDTSSDLRTWTPTVVPPDAPAGRKYRSVNAVTSDTTSGTTLASSRLSISP